MQRSRFSAILGGLMAVLLSLPLAAGGDAFGGKGLPLGDGTATPANKKAIRKTIEQLMKPRDPRNPNGCGSGMGMTEDQAVAAINQARANIKKAMDMAKLRMPADCAKWLQGQFDKGNVCLGWGMAAIAAILHDGTEEKKCSESVIIGAGPALGGPLTCHDPALILLSIALRHETQHACQSYQVAIMTTLTPEQGKKATCNEIDAHSVDDAWLCKLIDELCKPDNLDPNKPLPAGIDPAIKEALKSLRSIADKTERQRAATKLKEFSKTLKKANKNSIDCYNVAKKAFCDRIAGTITRAQLKAALNQAKWKEITSWLDRPAYVAMTNTAAIDQVALSTSVSRTNVIDTGLAHVMDITIYPTTLGGVLLVSGQTVAGRGELQAYRDLDKDQLFDEASRVVLFTDSERLTTNMGLTFDTSNGALYAYDSESRQILRLGDSDNDEVPDTLGEALSAPSALMDDYVLFQADQANHVPTLLGYPQVDLSMPGILHDSAVLVLQDVDGDGLYEQVFESNWANYAPRSPSFDAVPHGASVIDVYGAAGASLETWTVDAQGEPAELLGSGIGRGTEFRATIELERPLVAGEFLTLIDATHRTQTASYPTAGSFVTFGQGCGGGPSTVLDQSAACLNNVGTTAEYLLDNAPSSSPGLVILGTQQWNLDLAVVGAPGCSLYTDPMFTVPIVTNAAGHASFHFAIPNRGSLVGAAAHTQFAVIAPVNALGLVFSNAIRTTLGGSVRE